MASPSSSVPESLSNSASESGSVSNSNSASGSVSLSNGQSGSSVLPSSSSVLVSPSVTVGSSTFITTSNGVVLTRTVQVTSTIPAGTTITPAADNTKGNSSHAGAIAGAIVGGIAGLLILAFLVWYLRRRAKERQEAELFDGNFDPARTTDPTLPRISDAGGPIDDDGVGGRLAASTVGGGVVTPFTTGMNADFQPEMHQYYADRSNEIPTSPTTTSSYHPYAPTSVTSAYPTSVTSSNTGYPNPMSSKEREARGGFSVVNPNSPRPGSIAMPGPSNAVDTLPNPHSPSSSSGVVVHTDGGRVPEEIPPTYDSIRP